tara:strand:+ start:37 stop:189 length:153 start_codon:yes stop_codon:yes gene_type:complete
MKVVNKKTGKDVTSKVIKIIEESLEKSGFKIINSYTSDPDIRKSYKNSKK